MTPDDRELLRQRVMKEIDKRVPAIHRHYHDWANWPGTWVIADAAVAALGDEIERRQVVLEPDDAEAARLFATNEPRLSREKIRELAVNAGWRDLPTVRLAYSGFRLDEFAESVYSTARGLGTRLAEPNPLPMDCGEAGHAEGRCGNAACLAKPDDTTRCWYCRHEYPGAAQKCPACGSLTQKFFTKPKNDDTEARVRRVMEAADRYAVECAVADDNDRIAAARAELERVVRECVR